MSAVSAYGENAKIEVGFMSGVGLLAWVGARILVTMPFSKNSGYNAFSACGKDHKPDSNGPYPSSFGFPLRVRVGLGCFQGSRVNRSSTMFDPTARP